MAKPRTKRKAPGPKGKMQRPRGLTVEQVAEALRLSAGIQSVAAERLKVNRSTICVMVKKHPQLQDVIEEVTDEVVDLAEAKLIGNIRNGETNAIRYYLDHRGGDRGYGKRRVELTGVNGGPVQTQDVDEFDYDKLSVEELEQLEALRAKAAPDR